MLLLKIYSDLSAIAYKRLPYLEKLRIFCTKNTEKNIDADDSVIASIANLINGCKDILDFQFVLQNYYILFSFLDQEAYLDYKVQRILLLLFSCIDWNIFCFVNIVFVYKVKHKFIFYV